MKIWLLVHEQLDDFYGIPICTSRVRVRVRKFILPEAAHVSVT